MSTRPATAPVRSESDYEELLSLWADLEDGLAVLLASPRQVAEFEPRVRQYARWLRELLAQDADLGLYLLLQLAANSCVGYSASHALTCAVLCHLIGDELRLAPGEREALVHAALTMNIGMTALQDQLARQREPLSPDQQAAVQAHPRAGCELLRDLGVGDALWLEVVARHHEPPDRSGNPAPQPAAARLVRLLQAVDRYAALISPRKSREGRDPTASVRAAVVAGTTGDEAGRALARVVGDHPPGTLVRLEDGRLAVVLRRAAPAQPPHMAVVADPGGHLLARPLLLGGAGQRPRIQKALAGSALRLRLNHFRVLQLGTDASAAPGAPQPFF